MPEHVEETEAEWLEGGKEGGRIHREHVEGTERDAWDIVRDGLVHPYDTVQPALDALSRLRAEHDVVHTRAKVAERDRDLCHAKHSADEARISSLLTEREELREALREIEDWEPKRGNVQDAFDNVKAVARSVLSSRETTESNTSDERVAISAENEPPGLCPTCGRTGPDTLDVDFDTGATEAACGDPFHSTDSGKD